MKRESSKSCSTRCEGVSSWKSRRAAAFSAIPSGVQFPALGGFFTSPIVLPVTARSRVCVSPSRPRLFERVLVLRRGGAAVDRFERALLVARRGGYGGGAGLAGKGVLLDPFEEQFRVFVLRFRFRGVFFAFRSD